MTVPYDESQPATTRRMMAFTDAVFVGRARLEGVTALRVGDPAEVHQFLRSREVIPLLVGDFAAALSTVAPAVLVDARMRKRARPEMQRDLAPLVIGLGPNFIAGSNVDLAIETSWESLGTVVRYGATLALAGEPRPFGGHARERFVYAPHPGIFRTTRGIFRTTRVIGEPLQRDEVVAHVADIPLLAPLSGTLRGLTHNGVKVTTGTKVIEVDADGGPVAAGLGERPRCIAAGVVTALTPQNEHEPLSLVP